MPTSTDVAQIAYPQSDGQPMADNTRQFRWIVTIQGGLDAMEEIEPMEGWISPRLGIRFELESGVLQLYRPDGERFAAYVELMEQREQEHQRAEQEHQRAESLAARLQALGIEPEET